MKLNLPFLNRERYIVLRAYTPVEYLCDHAPVCLSSKVIPEFPRIGKYEIGFKTCHGFIASLKRSATVMSPCDFDVKATPKEFSYRWPDQQHFGVAEHVDTQWNSSTSFITKIAMPFVFKSSKKGINFVETRHILNDTPMNIPSGVTTYDYGTNYNPFNYIPRIDLEYSVTFKKPLIAIYPLSDLPFHVECYFDPGKYRDYVESCINRPRFKGFSFSLASTLNKK